MLTGQEVVAALLAGSFSHVVWIPDSDMGSWNDELARCPGLTLVRVCREAEAFAIAAGLSLGGKNPIILIQCTGLFDAGDALRNVLYDLQIPLLVLVGVRSLHAYRRGQSADSAARFTEAIVRAWELDYLWLDERQPAASFATAQARIRDTGKASFILYAE